jgi:hypothetical protein
MAEATSGRVWPIGDYRNVCGCRIQHSHAARTGLTTPNGGRFQKELQSTWLMSARRLENVLRFCFSQPGISEAPLFNQARKSDSTAMGLQPIVLARGLTIYAVIQPSCYASSLSETPVILRSSPSSVDLVVLLLFVMDTNQVPGKGLLVNQPSRESEHAGKYSYSLDMQLKYVPIPGLGHWRRQDDYGRVLQARGSSPRGHPPSWSCSEEVPCSFQWMHWALILRT